MQSYPRQYLETEPRMLAQYEVYNDRLFINDPAWGTCEIGNEPGDEVFLDLVHTPLVQRSVAIEQLSLPAEVTTIPGVSNMSRWEHIWGGVVFIRNITKDANMDPRVRTIHQLRAFVSDLGHTAYSHLGDWMFQGQGSAEDQHDQELYNILESTNINNILRKHGIEPREVIFPEIEDFVERSAPDLCVDRIDYGVRQIQRCFNLTPDMHTALQPESFVLRDSSIIMRDKNAALTFAKGFLLLASEHWSEPVHRLQLRLHEARVKRVLTEEITSLTVDKIDMPYTHHPRDLMYSIDPDITQEMSTRDPLLQILSPVMQHIGYAKRRIFTHEREAQLRHFLMSDTANYPDPLQHYDYFAHHTHKQMLLPSNITMIPVETEDDLSDFGTNPSTVDFFLGSLKLRAIDPLFLTESGDIQRLSQADKNFNTLLKKQADITRQQYVARIHVNHETKEVIERGLQEIEAKWNKALQRPRMKPGRFKDLITNAALLTVVSNMVEVEWCH
jgi:hypothetical protein